MKNSNKGMDQISERLIAYLKDKLNNPKIDYDLQLTQLQGGFETSIYHFKLKDVQKELSKPLILRLYPQFFNVRYVIRESIVQNVIAGEGYPVPRVYFTCSNISILGGAFFIMDFLSGEPMITAPFEILPEMLGKTHATLHNIDSESLIKSLSEKGIDKKSYKLRSRLRWLKSSGRKIRWVRESLKWLKNNLPPEPKFLSVCHGDFHPLNILIQEGKVTGVLDWGDFLIADPAWDVANTLFLTTMTFKHLVSELKLDLHSVDWDIVADQYLNSYRSKKDLDTTYLDYYKVMRSVGALIEGFHGQQVWQHPLIVKDLIEYIHKITEIRIKIQD